VHLEAQRGREALAAWVAGLAVHDDGDHRAIGMPRLEQADFLIDVVTLRRSRRTQHDERCRCIEVGDGLLGQAVPGGEILAVPEYGPERLGHWATRRVSSCEATHGETFKPLMQPLRPRRVGMAVG